MTFVIAMATINNIYQMNNWIRKAVPIATNDDRINRYHMFWLLTNLKEYKSTNGKITPAIRIHSVCCKKLVNCYKINTINKCDHKLPILRFNIYLRKIYIVIAIRGIGISKNIFSTSTALLLKIRSKGADRA